MGVAGGEGEFKQRKVAPILGFPPLPESCILHLCPPSPYAEVMFESEKPYKVTLLVQTTNKVKRESKGRDDFSAFSSE